MPEEFLFIDDDVNILTAGAAEVALAIQSDARFVEGEAGIRRVPRERWASAQKAERKHWMVLGLGANDDYNYDHAAGFDHYASLRDTTFSRAIELGCGPFTNLRIIADVCRIAECDLLDPLVESYLEHPGCRYSRTSLLVDQSRMNVQLRQFLRGHRRFGLERFTESGTVPIGRLVTTPIEEMSLDRTYDLVVMENVIEHCYDVDLVFANILSVLEPGGHFVIHDRYYYADRVAERTRTLFDAAHPLQVDRSLVDTFLSANFEPVYSKIENVAGEFMGHDVGAENYYFVGRSTESRA